MVYPFLGVLLHSIGGLAAGSFYIPFRKVKTWAWESYWLIQGVLAWVVMPWVAAALTAPGPLEVFSTISWSSFKPTHWGSLFLTLCEGVGRSFSDGLPWSLDVLVNSPLESLAAAYLFGVLWGIGGLTFGLSMRYLGMSLGYATALGFCAAFGTLIPPIYDGEFLGMFENAAGQMTLAGVLACLAGIAVCGRAGIRKERELTEEEKKSTIREFSLLKGFAVATFAGVMSACMAFALRAADPIQEIVVDTCGSPIFQGIPSLIVIMAGGFTTNCIWCLILNFKNRSIGDYVSWSTKGLAANYLFAGLAGVIWYGQFFFYSMGTTKMGQYDFSSWTIHMAFIIVFSNLWGIYFREWKGVTRRTLSLVYLGIFILILSTVVVGYGNYLKP